jgi:hypothetical protein
VKKIFFSKKDKLCSLILNPLDIKGKNWVRKRQKKTEPESTRVRL